MFDKFSLATTKIEPHHMLLTDYKCVNVQILNYAFLINIKKA